MEARTTPSLYDQVRRARPGFVPHVLSKAALVDLSRAIEHEVSQSSGPGILYGAFQEERHFSRSRDRWNSLAGGVDLAVAFAAFGEDTLDGPVACVDLSADHALKREWIILYYKPGGGGCMAAWEVATPAGTRDGDRRFEVCWITEPGSIASAALALYDTVAELAPDVLERMPSWMTDTAERRPGAAV